MVRGAGGRRGGGGGHLHLTPPRRWPSPQMAGAPFRLLRALPTTFEYQYRTLPSCLFCCRFDRAYPPVHPPSHSRHHPHLMRRRRPQDHLGKIPAPTRVLAGGKVGRRSVGVRRGWRGLQGSTWVLGWSTSGPGGIRREFGREGGSRGVGGVGGGAGGRGGVTPESSSAAALAFCRRSGVAPHSGDSRADGQRAALCIAGWSLMRSCNDCK